MRRDTDSNAVRNLLVAKTTKAIIATTPNHPMTGISELGAGTAMIFLMN
ncbi:unannotated protein [freshwater metagenome]|uniref:Unannotated protein n=1 Tax=freshwater metagenome TaxID=449393 RepID=A0A6J6N6G8_9ZZZZ